MSKLAVLAKYIIPHNLQMAFHQGTGPTVSCQPCVKETNYIPVFFERGNIHLYEILTNIKMQLLVKRMNVNRRNKRYCLIAHWECEEHCRATRNVFIRNSIQHFFSCPILGSHILIRVTPALKKTITGKAKEWKYNCTPHFTMGVIIQLHVY